MIYELRIYECYGGKLPDLHKRFADHTMALFEKHGIKNIGYWTYDVGPSNNELVYLVAFEDHNQRADAWASFRADPEWQRVFEDSHANGIIVRNVENRLLSPTAYSPMQ